ncbi:MAG: hypothetical protein L6R40_003199 [Gallowayella cf. fulva]|nr:MAG: hypothetical protein L6R40_003199 [Xanthomendoza cf. fulva]
MSSSQRPSLLPWYNHLTIDLLLHVGSYTLFHPFVASLLPLCLRALAAEYTSTSFILTSVYAALVVLCHVLSAFNQRWAYGPPRKINSLDEVVVVTGGASGLGRCIAEIYAMKGTSVAVIDVGIKEDDTVEREGVRWYKGDVGNRSNMEYVWKRICNDIGTPTILINNAAVVNGKPFLSLIADEVDNTFRVNTISHFHLTSLFLRPLLGTRTPGTLVTVSSILGRLGASNLSAYTASKASAIAFHTSLAAELRPSSPQIKTILVTPGQLDTAMFAHIKLDWFRNFFGPVVEVRDLAVRIVKMVDAGEGGTIAVPFFASALAWQQILPKGLQNWLKRWSGVDTAMMAPTHGGTVNEKVIHDLEEESESE